MREVKINSKKMSIRVLDEEDKELGIISFYPNDFEFPVRAEQGQKELMQLIKKVQEQAEQQDQRAFFQTMHELNEKAKKILNGIFNEDIAKLFGNTNMFTPLSDGKLLIENILDGIIPVIVEEINQCAEQTKSRTEKYLEDYK